MAHWRDRTRWFAAEFLVVVTGVLVALGVQSLYQRREDGRREIAWLRQLAAELQATEAAMAEADSFVGSADRSGARLLRAYRAPVPPDSIVAWLNDTGRFAFHLPVTGTAEAFVASGDLQLVRSDSLRGAIAEYVGRQRPKAGDSVGQGNQIIVRVETDEDLCRRISRTHFEIRRQGDEYVVVDLSKHGLWLNQIRLEHCRPTPVVTGNVLRIPGVIELEVLIDDERVKNGARSVPPSAISYETSSHRVSLEVLQGEIVKMEEYA